MQITLDIPDRLVMDIQSINGIDSQDISETSLRLAFSKTITELLKEIVSARLSELEQTCDHQDRYQAQEFELNYEGDTEAIA